ncbi:MAG: GH25 family lysozyme [Tissierellia bacterium]|nr:GH25 family lysozyme [Tissierellia bacterium]
MKHKEKLYILAILIVAIAFMLFTKRKPYDIQSPSVRGVDVSRYQGDIDWQALENQGMKFAFIKATEGDDHRDDYFEKNWKASHKTNMRVGAYHFYRFDIPGYEQAMNFIKTVPITDGMLPPAIDLEYYGDYINAPLPKEVVTGNLSVLLDHLTEHYGQYPIIYCNKYTYEKYVMGEFPNCHIWYRRIGAPPEIKDGREWLFWQYEHEGELKGYEGIEKHIDLNIFNGNIDELLIYDNLVK